MPEQAQEEKKDGLGFTRVTVEDGKGEPNVAEVKDDFLLITDGCCEVDGFQRWANGTVQITIKKRASNV